MNKIVKTWISFIITLAVVTSFLGYKPTISVQYALADPLNAVIYDESDLYMDTFACNYFINLKDNAAYNKAGSCGYVAIALLLSYYDTYWNDDIVPETYDQSSLSLDVSPGVRNEYEAFGGMTRDQYVNAIYEDENINNYFQFLLFKLARDSTGESTMSTFGVSYTKMRDMINYYLFSYLGLLTNECFVQTVNSNVEEFVKEKVSNGEPVIVGIPGHVTVAYDYDILQDQLYGYWGWRDSNNHAPYTNFSDAYAIALNLEHKHSDNYIINGVETCSCRLSYHVHNYDYNSKFVGDSGHEKICFCEMVENCAGTVTARSINASKHRKNCSCGYFEEETHVIDPSQLFVDNFIMYNTCLGCDAVIEMDSGFGEIIHPNRVSWEVIDA